MPDLYLLSLKEVYKLRYYSLNKSKSAVDYVYRNQEGIGADCQNVIEKNTGSYESREATEEDINNLGNHMGITWNIIK